jgi:hypothetical protein
MSIQVGKPVTGRDLIGRDEEITTILHLLKSGQSVVVIAPRRFGKTSLMFEVLRKIKQEKWFTCYVDLFSVPTLLALAERITESVLSNSRLSNLFRKFKDDVVELARQLQIKQEFEGTEFILGFAQKQMDEWRMLEQSIEFIESYACGKNKRMIATFDEFGDVKKLDGEKITKLFRSKIQVQKNTAYFFTGSYESVMNQIFVKENAPFYRFARIIHLGYIDQDSFLKYMRTILNKENIPYQKQHLTKILKITRGHPYYTQLMLQEMMIMYQLSKENQLPTIKKLTDRILLIEKNYLEKYWETISSIKEERMIITKLAENKTSIYGSINRKDINVARGIKNLIGKGVVFKKDTRYILADPIFELWIQKNVLL